MDKYIIKRVIKDPTHYDGEEIPMNCTYSKEDAKEEIMNIALQELEERNTEDSNIIIEKKDGCSCLYGDILTVQVTRQFEALEIYYYFIEKL